MITLGEVVLWGRVIGAVSLESGEDSKGISSFQYDPGFARSGIEVSPLVMPLSDRVYRFPELAPEAFHGLPGLLADSLPDRFGNALIDLWLAGQGRAPESFNAVERLCYTGRRGMGALEFRPAKGPRINEARSIGIEALVKLASQVLAGREEMSGSLRGPLRQNVLRDILRVGTSAGGARAKAVIAWNRETGEVRSGQAEAGNGFEHWLIKFDGVSGNRDRELAHPRGYGALEYAYHLMARAAGITMSECRLLEENGRRHFMTRRFDRLPGGEKLHMQTLGALLHLDYNQPGAHGYEQAFYAIRRLGIPPGSLEEMYRRMVFNIMARNQDDHVKNIAFLMDKQGRWSLSPAYDISFNFNPAGLWTARHQMTVNGKQSGFSADDLAAAADAATVSRDRAGTIMGDVRQALGRWGEFAAAAGVPEEWRRSTEDCFNLLT